MLALLVLVGIVAVLAVIGLLSGDGGNGGEQAVRTTNTAPRTTTQPKKKKKHAPQKRVRVRVVPATPTYVCVDRGAGTPVLFEGIIDTAETFHGKRVRLNMGKRDVQLWKNGKRVQVAPGSDPVGFALSPRHTRELPVGERPCA
jgi:hypothetical protein